MGRILAVDPDALARTVLVDALQALGHTPVPVGSGAAALARLAEGGIDLAIVEVSLPDIEGVELAARAGALPRPVPALLVSGSRRPVLRADEAVGFLPKPIDPDRLGRFLDVFYRRPVAARATREGADGWSGLEFLGAVDGPVERFPPLRVLFLVHRVAATGALVVERAGGTARIGVRGGRIVHVSGIPGLFAALGKLPDRQDLSQDLAAAVAAGHAPDRALHVAAEGVGAFLAELVDERGGRVVFDPSWKPPGGAFPLPEPIPRVIALGLAKSRSDARIARTWDALAAASIRRRVPEDSTEDRWGLDATQSRVLRLVTRARTVETLVREATGGDTARHPDVARALDALHLLGLVVVDGGAEEPGDPTREDPRAARLAEALAAMEKAHPVEILELADRKLLTEQDVANGYRDISRRYHPDTFFSAPPAVRAVAEACFAKVNAAYEAIRVPGGMAEARRFMEARALGVPFVSEKDHLAARVAFRKAEPLLRGRDYRGADAFMEEAARLDPNTWPHVPYAAWTGWLAKRLTAAQALAQLDALKVTQPPRIAEVQVCAGNILKQEGKMPEAIARYQAALKAQPENRDAQREIRLHETRSGGTQGGGGVLGGLLKR